MKYGKTNTLKNQDKKLDKETLKKIRAFGSIVIIRGGSLFEDD